MTRDNSQYSPWLPVSRLAHLLGPSGFLVSDFGTLGVACYVAVRLHSDPLTWVQAGAFGLMTIAALWFTRLLLGLVARARGTDRWEGVRFAVGQGAALFAVHPYVRSGLLGSGDAASYSLILADFREQWHSGIFPVLIGQSPFAFSGGFHLTRTAPYILHLASVFDLLSLGTLNVFALLNLTVLASMIGGVLGCYAALRISLPGGRWLALGLAILYGLCPGVLAPLYGGDMYPTFMTLPFLPWLFLGVGQSSISPNRLWPWALQGAAVAALWLAHPPVAAWATLLAGAAALGTVIRAPRGKVLSGMAFALGLFLALDAYLFVSVRSLGLPTESREGALETIDYKIGTLHADWESSFLPVSRDGNHLLGDVQLGYGLWACMLLALPAALRERSGRALLGCFALILLFAWPVPILTRFAWRSLPTELLWVTNQWPLERFYVILAALAVFVIAPAFSRYLSRGPWQRLSIGALLLAACLWSAAESAKFFRRAAAISHSETSSENLHLPENITLSRTHSYEYVGTPSYFSYGHMDPRLETRLLDMDTRRVFADGSTYVAGSPGAAPKSRDFALQKLGEGISSEPLRLGPGQAQILRFDFLGQRPEGELFRSSGDPFTISTPCPSRACPSPSVPGLNPRTP